MGDQNSAKKRNHLYMGGTAHFNDNDLQDIVRFSILPKKTHKMPSISDNAKRAKDKLQTDPYNMELINELGQIYASEAQWDKAANVMLRGWKRASELKDPGDRFEFLMKLAEASFRNRQYRQADATLAGIDEPEDYHQRKAFQLLSCHTKAELGNQKDSLGIFNKAVEDEEFDAAVKIWAAVALRLKKVGVFDASKNTLIAKARSGHNRSLDMSKLDQISGYADMSANPEKKDMFNFEDGIPKWMIGTLVGLGVLLFLYLLYWLEQRSLEWLHIGWQK